ncbi:hypothetical protein M9Y10_025697 [Tritrichomonas musculus]|uniref:Uncharacterized protein n=1 Tax=Tritrichomonas musculus TaxID=1915356 RepID=A0ABR2H9K0_9EUKA
MGRRKISKKLENITISIDGEAIVFEFNPDEDFKDQKEVIRERLKPMAIKIQKIIEAKLNSKTVTSNSTNSSENNTINEMQQDSSNNSPIENENIYEIQQDLTDTYSDFNNEMPPEMEQYFIPNETIEIDTLSDDIYNIEFNDESYEGNIFF